MLQMLTTYITSMYFSQLKRFEKYLAIWINYQVCSLSHNIYVIYDNDRVTKTNRQKIAR